MPETTYCTFPKTFPGTAKQKKEKETIDKNIKMAVAQPFILVEGISKSILFYFILNFAILSVFNVRNVIIWH